MADESIRAGAAVAITCGLIIVLLVGSAWAQSPDPPTAVSFRVSWRQSTGAQVSLIEGQVANPSAAWVTDVRLRVEGVNTAGHPVGVRFAWALGDILPGGETSFVVGSMPGAVDYRISVASFNLVLVSPSPSR
jgi:hypothetical protein